jgi:hypothetical protein
MFLGLLLVQFILFGLVLYRLVTTNHWTIGKKLLVGLTGTILLEVFGFICAIAFQFSLFTLIFINIPKVIMSAIMVYYFYRSEVHVD